ncbi:MAG: hypothetical protein CMP11_02995 [Zetaproteobacteria bacterium]|nr:hypothetical protein [Pseudobdellovibrionaceae bacterium]
MDKKLHVKFLVFVVFLFFYKPLFSGTLNLRTFPFENFDLEEESFSKKISLPEMTAFAILNGYETREKGEDLLQKKYMIDQSFGRILPHIGLSTVVAFSLGNFIEVASSFVGFMFPSRWYSWKEKSSLSQAEKESFRTFLANRINEIETIYYNIHLFTLQVKMINFYKNQIINIISTIEGQIEKKGRKITDEEIGLLYTIKAQLSYRSRYIQSELQKVYSNLFFLLGLNGNLKGFCIEMISLKKIDEEVKEAKDPDFNEVYRKSREIKNLDALKQASKFSLKQEIYSYFQPQMQNPIGWGYFPSIKISRSRIKQIEVYYQKTLADLKRSTEIVIIKKNQAVEQYKIGLRQKTAMDGPTRALERNILNIKEQFDIEKAIRFFDFGLEGDSIITANIHLFWQAKSHMNRLLWQGKNYDGIEEVVVKYYGKNKI